MNDLKSTIGICRSAAEAMLSDNIQWRLDPRYILKLCEEADRIQTLERENAELRLTISKCAAALGNGAYISTEASLGFMAELPKEISIVTAELRAAKEQVLRAALEEAAKVAHDRLVGWGLPNTADNVANDIRSLIQAEREEE